MAATGTEKTAQVRIHLSTRDEKIRLPDTGPILVSSELRRYQLSTLVNRLLETEQPVPLEFLINGQFLRTSLDDFLTQNGISAETALNVEYVKALIPPLFVTSYEHDDWVSSVDVLSNSSRSAQWAKSQATVQDRILSASYDGNLRVWNTSSEVVATGTGHTAAVKTAKFLSPTQIVSAGIDRALRIWKYEDSPTTTASLTPTLELYGHKSSIDNIALHAPTSHILSASSDHTLGLWSTRKSDAPPATSSLLPTSSNKRRKLSTTSKPTPQRGPLALLSSHNAQVSDVSFDARDPSVAYSTSWDHTLKTWDLATSTCVDTRTTAQSLFSLCHLPDAGLVATGTSARHISLIDPRVSATSVSAMTLRGHTNAVVALAEDPGSMWQMVSGSHDGTCRVWDLRSAKQDVGAGARVGESVYVVEREGVGKGKRMDAGEGVKVFGVCWDEGVGIVSCGEDRRVQVNKGST